MSEPIRDVETAVREFGALPVPAGPERLPFPPEPRSEEERLRMQVVDLEDQLTQATKAAARAQRERDLMRERVSEPFGCKYCGEAKRFHGRRYLSGMNAAHTWERPSDEQVKTRMLARRAARMPLAEVSADRRERYAAALFEFVNGAFVWGACDDKASWLEEADAAIAVADFEQTGLRSLIESLEFERHSTNESLSEAAEALRVQRDRIAELEKQVRLLNTQRGDVAQLIEREGGHGEECVDIDDLTAALCLGSDDVVDAPPRDANCGRPGCDHWGGFHSVGNGCQAHVQAPGEPVEFCPCSEFVAGSGGAE